MGRTFVFVWAFTLPFAIVQDISNIYAACCALFFITFGFIGIELVSIELDDPFGDDPNDLDVMAMAQVRDVVCVSIFVRLNSNFLQYKSIVHMLTIILKFASSSPVEIYFFQKAKKSLRDTWSRVCSTSSKWQPNCCP